MPRPMNPNTSRYELRAEPDQLEAWQACADEDGRSLAAWIRRALDAEVKRAKRRKQ